MSDVAFSSAVALEFSNFIFRCAAANVTATFDTRVVALTADEKRAGGSGDRSGLGGAAFAACQMQK